MFFNQATLLVFLAFLHISLQATDDGISPVLTINVADVELQEKEDARVRLGPNKVVTCEDADGDQIRAYIESIVPTSGCGLKCLQLEPLNNNPKDYKLMFQPTVGFGTTPSYTLTIACTDDVEAVVKNTMSVTIVTNTPPTFKRNPAEDSVSTNGQKTSHDTNYELYKVQTVEPDDDPVVFTMSTEPITDLIEMEYATGQIRASQDLRLLCETLVKASVTARDPYNAAAGTFTLDINIDKNNVRPTITNLDTTITIDEDLGVGKRVLAFDVVDGKLADFTYNQISLTSEGMESYVMDGNALRTRIPLNYEREEQRSLKLYFTVNDGYCQSETYALTVDLNDVAEEPVLTPEAMFIETYEGEINVPSNAIVLDDDLNEVHTFSEEKGSADEFDVDPINGNIVSVGAIALKKNKKSKDYSLKMKVTDKDGLESNTMKIEVRVWDSNDQRPYFKHDNRPLRLSALDCTPPGASLGRLKGDDDDSVYNQNNWYYFAGGGGNFAVAANGKVALTEYCINGESYSGSATIADQGIVPGPLTGETMEIILDCGPCPPGGYPGEADDDEDTEEDATEAPTGGTTVPTNATEAPEEPVTVPDADGLDLRETLTWSIPALLAGAVWLAITAMLLYRFFPPIKCGSPSPNVIQVTPEPPKSLQPRTSLPPAPPKPANPPAPPPPQPRVVSPSEPYLYDFWKETYTNQDQHQHPNHLARPTAIENMPAAERNAPPANLRLGPQQAFHNAPPALPGNGNLPPAEVLPKSRSCAIL